MLSTTNMNWFTAFYAVVIYFECVLVDSVLLSDESGEL